MKRIKLFITALSVLVAQQSLAQDIHFSQFYETAILRNPALTGIFSGDYKVGVNYRTQWSNISVPFQTILVSGETRIAISKETGDYVSFGLCATYDKAGSISFNSLQVYPAINYNKAIEDRHHSYLSVGFAGGYIQRSVDFSKATYSSQYVNGVYDPATASGESFSSNTIQNYDLGAGVSFNSSIGEKNNINYYIGASAYHIAKPRHSFAGSDYFVRLDTKWSGNLGVKYAINNTYAVTVHANYSNQSPYQETLVGGLVSWNNSAFTRRSTEQYFAIYAGFFARLKDALIPTMKVDYKNYSLTCSYDINTSSLNPATGGSGGTEISLFVRGMYNKTANAGDRVQCPRFEQMMPMF